MLFISHLRLEMSGGGEGLTPLLLCYSNVQKSITYGVFYVAIVSYYSYGCLAVCLAFLPWLPYSKEIHQNTGMPCGVAETRECCFQPRCPLRARLSMD